ncbi:MAG: hypothetical protein KDB23_18315, partial [Planctomycetales bacterium]|nr:hypothetical protein [Planctomycetales bacterium]
AMMTTLTGDKSPAYRQQSLRDATKHFIPVKCYHLSIFNIQKSKLRKHHSSIAYALTSEKTAANAFR